VEAVIAHEVGHAIANVALDFPIEFTSISFAGDGLISGFTKNDPQAKAAVDTALRAGNRARSLQIAAIQFAGPLTEYRYAIARGENVRSISRYARQDKQEAFKCFCFANRIEGAVTFRYDLGDFDFSVAWLTGRKTEWQQWRAEGCALAKATLDTPAAVSAAKRISSLMISRARQGHEAVVFGSEVSTALSAATTAITAQVAPEW
jgi:hypothetical protein